MFRSVFSRLLVPYVIILLFTLILQGALITQLIRNDYYDKVKKELKDNTQDLADLTTNAFEKTISQDSPETLAMISAMNTLRVKYDATVWMVDSRGLFMRFESVKLDFNNFNGQEQQTLSHDEINEYLNRLMQGQTLEEEGYFNNRFDAPMLTLGYPISVDGSVMGALLVNVKISTLNRIDSRYYYLIGLFSLGTTMVGALFIFAVSRRIANPLHQMNAIAGEIARGRFDKRVTVNSRDEIGQLAQSFNLMAAELKKHEQLQSGFVANVSHELRSPMTSMQGFAQGMLDGTIPSEEYPKYLGIIREESMRLTKLIRELLDLAQIESGQFPLNIQRFDVNELIRRVLVRYIDQIEEKDVELNVDFTPEYNYVMADSDRIEQVVVNLLDNAIKFVDVGGQIRLWTHQADENVLISIGNTGSVIPEEDLPYIFERFYKVDKSHTGRKGTGLGLSIVQRILDQHRQTITVRSRESDGTSFCIQPQARRRPK